MSAINIHPNGLTINDTVLEHPFQFNDFITVLGEPKKLDNPNSNNRTYVWNDEGIRVFVNPDNLVLECDIYLIENPKAKYIPEGLFNGTITIDGEPYESAITISPEDHLFTVKRVGDTTVDVQLTRNEPQQIKVLTIIGPELPKPDVKKIFLQKAAQPLHFADFNFKLAIINELMYEQKVLTPAFNLQSVANVSRIPVYTINTLNFDPVQKAIQFFEEYEIDASYAPLVTSLYLDGGNEIYRNIAPHWDGESDDFDIKTFADVTLFPNLKVVTNELFPMNNALKDELTSKGISVH